MYQLRRFAAEGLEGFPVAAEQGGYHIQPPLLCQAQQGVIHYGGAGPLLLTSVVLPVSQPVQELLRVQIQLGGDLAQLEELGAVGYA